MIIHADSVATVQLRINPGCSHWVSCGRTVPRFWKGGGDVILSYRTPAWDESRAHQIGGSASSGYFENPFSGPKTGNGRERVDVQDAGMVRSVSAGGGRMAP